MPQQGMTTDRDFASDRWKRMRQRMPGPPARSTSPAAR